MNYQNVQDRIIGQFGIGMYSCFLVSDNFYFISFTNTSNEQGEDAQGEDEKGEDEKGEVIVSYKRKWTKDSFSFEVWDYNNSWINFSIPESKYLENGLKDFINEERNSSQNQNFTAIAIILKNRIEPPPQNLAPEIINAQQDIINLVESLFPDSNPNTAISNIKASVRKYLYFLEPFFKLEIQSTPIQFIKDLWEENVWDKCLFKGLITNSYLEGKIGFLDSIPQSSSNFSFKVFNKGFLVQNHYKNLLPSDLPYTIMGYLNINKETPESPALKKTREEFMEQSRQYLKLQEFLYDQIKMILGSSQFLQNKNIAPRFKVDNGFSKEISGAETFRILVGFDGMINGESFTNTNLKTLSETIEAKKGKTLYLAAKKITEMLRVSEWDGKRVYFGDNDHIAKYSILKADDNNGQKNVIWFDDKNQIRVYLPILKKHLNDLKKHIEVSSLDAYQELNSRTYVGSYILKSSIKQILCFHLDHSIPLFLGFTYGNLYLNYDNELWIKIVGKSPELQFKENEKKINLDELNSTENLEILKKILSFQVKDLLLELLK